MKYQNRSYASAEEREKKRRKAGKKKVKKSRTINKRNETVGMKGGT